MNLQKLGDNLKKARNKSLLTQLELAKKVGINANYYARIERGEETPSMEVLEAISKVLKVKSADILPF